MTKLQNYRITKYTAYSLFKLVGGLFMLWLLVDKATLPIPNTLTRIIVYTFWFFVNYSIYGKHIFTCEVEGKK